MPSRFVITGTDTGIGKTVFSAALTSALDAFYWKPIQAGLAESTDSENVSQLAEIRQTRILQETYRLNAPLSPHRAAELESKIIDPDKLILPAIKGQLVIEGAGGVLAPLTRQTVYADIFARWGLPVILISRTSLGAINHALLSLEALQHRSVDILGITFIGDEQTDTQRTICEMGRVRPLGRLPFLQPLTPQALKSAFAAQFDLADFAPQKAA